MVLDNSINRKLKKERVLCMEDAIKKQMIYLAAWGVLKKIFNEGKIDISIVEKINKRNAETLVCDYLPIS